MAAAILVVGILVWHRWLGGHAAPDQPSPAAPADAELIAALDVLQRWDLLMSDDPNLQLASLGPLDEVLFEATEADTSAGSEDAETALVFVLALFSLGPFILIPNSENHK